MKLTVKMNLTHQLFVVMVWPGCSVSVWLAGSIL